MNLPIALSDGFASGDGVIWVGAGCSAGSGLPSWDRLVGEMRRIVATQTTYTDAELSPLTHLEMAQLFRTTVSPNFYYRYLKSQLDEGRSVTEPGNSTLNAVAGLVNHLYPDPGVVLISTNFDNLLEDAMKARHGKRLRKVFTKGQLAGMDESDLLIIKPNGDIEEPESIVFTIQDYCEYRAKKPEFADWIASLLGRKTFLFIGYGLSDFTFNSMLGEIQATLGSFKRRAYAIVHNDSRCRSEVLKSLGVETILVDSYDEIPPLLANLARESSKRAGRPSTFVSETLVNTTFLLVDDDPNFIDNVKRFYEMYGWTGLEAVMDAGSAIRSLQQKSFDFILTDLILPPPSHGLEIVRAARSSELNAKSVLAAWTSEPSAAERSRCLEAGADTVLSKSASLPAVFLELYALKRLRDGAYSGLLTR